MRANKEEKAQAKVQEQNTATEWNDAYHVTPKKRTSAKNILAEVSFGCGGLAVLFTVAMVIGSVVLYTGLEKIPFDTTSVIQMVWNKTMQLDLVPVAVFVMIMASLTVFGMVFGLVLGVLATRRRRRRRLAFAGVVLSLFSLCTFIAHGLVYVVLSAVLP